MRDGTASVNPGGRGRHRGSQHDPGSLLQLATDLELVRQIVGTAVQVRDPEIFHKVELKEEDGHDVSNKRAGLMSVVMQIMVIDIVFSLDSVITAVGIAKHVWVMALVMVSAVPTLVEAEVRVPDVNYGVSFQPAELAFPGSIFLGAELDRLTRELSRAVGLGGKSRKAGDAAERARVNVQRRLRDAIRRIAAHDAGLGRHLEWAVRTGTFCSYDPR